METAQVSSCFGDSFSTQYSLLQISQYLKTSNIILWAEFLVQSSHFISVEHFWGILKPKISSEIKNALIYEWDTI